jgi:hypothetical protein
MIKNTHPQIIPNDDINDDINDLFMDKTNDRKICDIWNIWKSKMYIFQHDYDLGTIIVDKIIKKRLYNLNFTKRYNFILAMILGNVTDNSIHANLLVIDHYHKTIHRFEPHKNIFTMYNVRKINGIIIDIINNTNTIKSYSYYNPHSFQKNGPQKYDTFGYCAMYCFRFMHLILLNPQLSMSEINDIMCTDKGEIKSYVQHFLIGHNYNLRNYKESVNNI